MSGIRMHDASHDACVCIVPDQWLNYPSPTRSVWEGYISWVEVNLLISALLLSITLSAFEGNYYWDIQWIASLPIIHASLCFCVFIALASWRRNDTNTFVARFLVAIFATLRLSTVIDGYKF